MQHSCQMKIQARTVRSLLIIPFHSHFTKPICCHFLISKNFITSSQVTYSTSFMLFHKHLIILTLASSLFIGAQSFIVVDFNVQPSKKTMCYSDVPKRYSSNTFTDPHFISDMTKTQFHIPQHVRSVDLPRPFFEQMSKADDTKENKVFWDAELFLGRSGMVLGIYMIVYETMTGTSVFSQLSSVLQPQI